MHQCVAVCARTSFSKNLLVLTGLLLLGMSASAQDSNRWITDSFEVTMRTGKSTKQNIVRMLSSGTRVEVIEVDRESGYARVRTRSGTEGWVLLRYLLDKPPARVSMPGVEQQLSQSRNSQNELEQKLRSVTRERDQLRGQAGSLERSGANLQSELDEVRRLSANVIEVDEQNRQLRERVAASEQKLSELQRDNDRLANRSSREWFVVGAGVVILGMALGLILPRIRWRRKSSWSEL
ncbi:MAG: TIGR04211 family SH3 domain-containing protein [Gammaproteobacteria bacterium]